MSDRCMYTDRLMTQMGLDPDHHASAEGRRKYGDAYGHNMRSVAKAIEMGGDPETIQFVDGNMRMELLK